MNLLYTIDQKSLFYREPEKKIGLEFCYFTELYKQFYQTR